jgi:hypothetical protein
LCVFPSKTHPLHRRWLARTPPPPVFIAATRPAPPPTSSVRLGSCPSSPPRVRVDSTSRARRLMPVNGLAALSKRSRWRPPSRRRWAALACCCM